jgi:hypothetical protein
LPEFEIFRENFWAELAMLSRCARLEFRLQAAMTAAFA